MRRVIGLVIILLCAARPLWAQDKNNSNELLSQLGTDRGICVLLGDTTGEKVFVPARRTVKFTAGKKMLEQVRLALDWGREGEETVELVGSSGTTSCFLEVVEEYMPFY